MHTYSHVHLYTVSTPMLAKQQRSKVKFKSNSSRVVAKAVLSDRFSLATRLSCPVTALMLNPPIRLSTKIQRWGWSYLVLVRPVVELLRPTLPVVRGWTYPLNKHAVCYRYSASRFLGCNSCLLGPILSFIITHCISSIYYQHIICTVCPKTAVKLTMFTF